MLLSTSLCHVLMRKLSLMIPFRGKGSRLCRIWVRFLAKQENLRGTGRLHPLVHISLPRSDAQAMFEDSIVWYGRPFMQTDGLICVLHANNRKCYGG